MRPILLDLFCGAGGAAKGYHDAGFDVIGVDLAPQPRYPFEFHQADALKFLEQFDASVLAAAHGSPPCQGYSRMSVCRPGVANRYARLIDVVRDQFARLDIPWVIENVEGSGLAAQNDLLGTNGLLLCGAMFGARMYRHRLFESSIPLASPAHPRHLTPSSPAGHWKPGAFISVAGNCSPIKLAREAMAIDWMSREELAESIPPYYTQFIGEQLLAHLAVTA